MQHHRKLTLALPAVALLFFYALFLPPTARADNLTITSGFVNIGGAPLSRNAWRAVQFNFAGNNFAASGGTNDGTAQGVSSSCGFGPCAPGTAASPGAGVTLDGVGQATFNGASVNAWWFAGDSHLTFTGLDVVISNSSASTLILTTPFTMTGSVLVHALDNSSHPLLFSTNVSGSGIATLTFQYFPNLGPGGYVLSNVRYDFAAIPEPTTLVLLGTGLAGLAARRRRRRRKANSA